MKRAFITFAIIFCTISLFAQEKIILMFDDFCDTTIKFKNKTTAKISANYDMGRQLLLFKDNGEVLELVRTETIDSICIGERKFVPYYTNLLEVVKMNGGTLYINWHQKSISIGSKGVFGDITLGTVKNLYTPDSGMKTSKTYKASSKDQVNSAEVYREKNDNEYMLFINDKFVSFNSVKQLSKIYPEKETQLKKFSKEHKLDFNYVEDVLKLMEYCFSI